VRFKIGCASMKGVTLASAMTGRSLRDVLICLVEGVTSKLDYMEGIQHEGGINAVLVVPGRELVLLSVCWS